MNDYIQSMGGNNSFEDNQGGSILIPKIDIKEKMKRSSKLVINIKKRKKLIIMLILVFVFVIAAFIYTALLLKNVYNSAFDVKTSVYSLVDAIKSQDLGKVNSQIDDSQKSIEKLKKDYKKILFLRSVPYLGKYIDDGDHAINALLYGLDTGKELMLVVEPYADVIGFKSGSREATSAAETTQDRIDFIVKTLPEIVPKADVINEKLSLIEKDLAQIDPNDYPERFRGYEVRSNLSKGLELFSNTASFVKKGKPMLEVMPDIIGAVEEKTYLIIFQNDKELRPTGGFITAYSIAKVEKAKFEPVVSSDIYNLDNGYKPTVTAPEQFSKYLKGPYILNNKYRLRDMNWDPDFKESMELFSKEAEKVGIKDVDGIIAVDTKLLEYLLDVLGEVGVPGFGNFSTKIVPECNCPQVIYELESFADVEGPIVWSENEPGKIVYAPENYDNRKKIIGPLMNSILANTLGQPKEKLPLLLEAAIKSLTEKHVLFYFSDEDTQKALEEFGIAGRVEEYKGDYLLINDANLGGRKSNLYVTQEVDQKIDIKSDGSVEKTLTITYKNPKEYDGWLNSVLPNWVRIYVPQGSQLIEFSGIEDKEDAYEEYGKTVFAGFFQLRPQGVVKVTLKYKLPYKFRKEYRIYVQKQAGKDKILYRYNIGKKEIEYVVDMDKEFKFSIL